MVSTNFYDLNVNHLIFIISTVIGSEKVIDGLKNTLERHIAQMEIGWPDNLKELNEKTSIQIIEQCWYCLSYIDAHSVELFHGHELKPLSGYLKQIQSRYSKIVGE